MLCSPFREGDSAHGDRPASEEREGASPRRKRKASSTEEEDGGGRACTRMDGTAVRLLRVEDATAAAFRAVLHFLYSHEPLFEQGSPIDQMRCARPVPRYTHACAVTGAFPGDGPRVQGAQACAAGLHIGSNS